MLYSGVSACTNMHTCTTEASPFLPVLVPGSIRYTPDSRLQYFIDSKLTRFKMILNPLGKFPPSIGRSRSRRSRCCCCRFDGLWRFVAAVTHDDQQWSKLYAYGVQVLVSFLVCAMNSGVYCTVYSVQYVCALCAYSMTV